MFIKNLFSFCLSLTILSHALGQDSDLFPEVEYNTQMFGEDGSQAVNLDGTRMSAHRAQTYVNNMQRRMFNTYQDKEFLFDDQFNQGFLDKVIQRLNADKKVAATVLPAALRGLYSAYSLTMQEDMINEEEHARTKVRIVSYNPWEVAEERGISYGREEDEETVYKLFKTHHLLKALKDFIDKAPYWQLHLDTPIIKDLYKYLEWNIENGDPRIREVFETTYNAAKSLLYNKLDRGLGEGVYKIKPSTDYKEGTEEQKLLAHTSICLLHAANRKTEDFRQRDAWVFPLYEAIYNYFIRNNKRTLLKLPKEQQDHPEFEMPPTLLESPRLAIQEEKVAPAIKAPAKVKKKSKKEKAAEAAELEALLAFITDSKDKASRGSHKKKGKNKKVQESKASSPPHSPITEEPEEEELPQPVAVAEPVEEDPFAAHIRKTVTYANRVEDWFRKLPTSVSLSDHVALHRQGYHVPGTYRHHLLETHGAEVIIANHRLPRVMDQTLLYNESFIVEQDDGSFKVELPAYRQHHLGEGKVRRDFGIFEVAYRLHNKKREVYHRFFRPVEAPRVLVDAFGLSKQDKTTLTFHQEITEHEFTAGWTIEAEREGWVLNMDIPGLTRIVNRAENISYAVMDLN